MTRCIIIEDEEHAATYLSQQLKTCFPDINIQASIDSIEDAVVWLSHNETDLILADIQIGDGLSFEIFDHISTNTPIIFTTSYHQYAIKAFELNSIAYLLKPIKQSELKKSFEKYKKLYEQRTSLSQQIATLNQNYQEKFIVHSGLVFQTLKASDVAYFKLQDKRYLFIYTTDQKLFMYDSSLELLESRLNPQQFFRINRQFIINRQNIKHIKQIERGRFLISPTFESPKEELIVSIGRSKTFKHWFNS